MPVYLDVGATRIHEHRDIAAHKYSKVVFNFPHIGGGKKKHNIQEHRDLLLEMFKSARRVVRDDGQMVVSLCRGQGGTELDEPYCTYEKSWQVAEMGAHGDFIIVSVEPYVTENFPDYKCHDADFSLTGALVHVFSKCISVFPEDIDEALADERLEMTKFEIGTLQIAIPNFLHELYERNPLRYPKSPVSFFKDQFVRELRSIEATRKPVKVLTDEDIPLSVISDKGVPCCADDTGGGSSDADAESVGKDKVEETEDEDDEGDEESEEESEEEESTEEESEEEEEEKEKEKEVKPEEPVDPEKVPEKPEVEEESPVRLRMSPMQILNEALTVWEEFSADGYVFHPGMYFNELITRDFVNTSPVNNQFLLIGRGSSMLCYRFIASLAKIFRKEGLACYLRPRNTKGDKMPHPRETIDKIQPASDIFKWHVGLEWVYSYVDQSAPDTVVCNVFSLLYKGSVVDACIIYPDRLTEFFFGKHTWRQCWSDQVTVKKFKNAPPEVLVRKPGLNPPVFEMEAVLHLGEKPFNKEKTFRTLWLAAGHVIEKAEKMSDSGNVSLVIKYRSHDIPLYRRRVQDIHQKIVCKMLSKVLKCPVG